MANHDILAKTLKNMPGTENTDFAVEYARLLLLTVDNAIFTPFLHTRTVGILQDAYTKVTRPSDRAHILRLLGRTYAIDGSYRKGYETLLKSLEIEVDSTAIYAMGIALEGSSKALTRVSFKSRISSAVTWFVDRGELLRRHICLAKSKNEDPRVALESRFSEFNVGWLRKVDLDEMEKPVVELSAANKKVELFALREVLKRIPAKTCISEWRFDVVGRPAVDLSTYNNLLLTETDLAALRFHPVNENGRIRLAVFVGKQLPKDKEGFNAALTDAVVAAVGEAPFLKHFHPEFFLWQQNPEEPGYSLEELRSYFFARFPEARSLTLDDVPIDWQDFKAAGLTDPGAPFFADIREGRTLFPELFDPSIFTNPDSPGLDFSRTMENFGATTVMIVFDVVRTPETPEVEVKNRYSELVGEFTRALEKEDNAIVVGTALGSHRAYVTAVLKEPDLPLTDVVCMVKLTPSIAWALVQTLFPMTQPMLLGVNDKEQMQKAFASMRLGLEEPVADILQAWTGSRLEDSE